MPRLHGIRKKYFCPYIFSWPYACTWHRQSIVKLCIMLTYFAAIWSIIVLMKWICEAWFHKSCTATRTKTSPTYAKKITYCHAIASSTSYSGKSYGDYFLYCFSDSLIFQCLPSTINHHKTFLSDQRESNLFKILSGSSSVWHLLHLQSEIHILPYPLKYITKVYLETDI